MVWQAGGHHVSVHVYQSWLALWHLYDLTDSGVVVVVIVWKTKVYIKKIMYINNLFCEIFVLSVPTEA
jgi:hypothetical protein